MTAADTDTPAGRIPFHLLMLAAGLLAVTVAAAVLLHRQSNAGYVATHIVHAVLYGAAVLLLVWRPLHGRWLAALLLVAVAMRLIALTAPPTLTTDAYRYVWDGRVQADGINPYLYVPADPALAHLRDREIFPNINRAETHPTIYPPVAEMSFFLGTRLIDAIRGQQIVMLAFDLVAIAAILAWLGIAGLPRERVLIYAWHPLTVWEFAGMAHVDAVGVAFLSLACLAGARGRQALAGIAFAAAGLVKYHYVLFVPAVWRRWRFSLPLAMAAAVLAFYLPYISAGPKLLGSLFTHLGEEGYQDGYGFYLVGMPRHLGLPFIPPKVFAGLAALGLAAAGLASALRRDPENVSPGWLLALGTAFVILGLAALPLVLHHGVAAAVHPALCAPALGDTGRLADLSGRDQRVGAVHRPQGLHGDVRRLRHPGGPRPVVAPPGEATAAVTALPGPPDATTAAPTC